MSLNVLYLQTAKCRLELAVPTLSYQHAGLVNTGRLPYQPLTSRQLLDVSLALNRDGSSSTARLLSFADANFRETLLEMVVLRLICV